jgi:hypothetical protein
VATALRRGSGSCIGHLPIGYGLAPQFLKFVCQILRNLPLPLLRRRGPGYLQDGDSRLICPRIAHIGLLLEAASRLRRDAKSDLSGVSYCPKSLFGRSQPRAAIFN